MAFKKRHDDALRKVRTLSEMPQQIDFAHYRSTLKNRAVIDEVERQFKAWQPKSYDVSRQIKAIEAFEGQAVQSAEETKIAVDKELKELELTLRNIEEARPFEDLTVVCCSAMSVARQADRGRTISQTRSPRSTSEQSSLSRRGSGTCRAIM
jgi:phosphopantetheine adenylyltransferase